MSAEQDARRARYDAAPGVYTEEQARTSKLLQELAEQQRKAAAEAYETGYRFALTHLDDEGVQADRRRYTGERTADLEQRLGEALADRDHAREEARENREDYQRACELVAQLYEAGTGRRGEGPRAGVVEDVADERARLTAECERLRKGWDQAYRQGWRQGQDQRLAFQREAEQAREQAAECMRETAQLHRQLDSLGVDPERLASMVGRGQAVELFGRVYVDRELASSTYTAAAAAMADPPTEGQLELLEAEGGVFVPIPKGHMLSVTVTPYEDQPAD